MHTYMYMLTCTYMYIHVHADVRMIAAQLAQLSCPAPSLPCHRADNDAVVAGGKFLLLFKHCGRRVILNPAGVLRCAALCCAVLCCAVHWYIR